MKQVLSLLTVALLLVACGGNPNRKGQRLAKEYDACIEDYNVALEKVGEDFAKKIPGNYTSRAKAMSDYKSLLLACHKEYQAKWTEIEQEERKVRGKLKESSQIADFENGLTIDRQYLVFCNEPDFETMSVPPAVLQQIRNINPPKPDEAQIALDLVGHTLSEGKEEGYYPQSWTWSITEGGVSNVQIVSIKENTNSRYTVDVSMRLSSETRAYDAKATVSYVLDDISDWKIENVHSLGMDIVKTHRYDDCVKCYYTKGLAGGLTAENNCEIALEVAGKELTYSGKWEKFCRVVPPHTQARISWSETDFIVDYVERP